MSLRVNTPEPRFFFCDQQDPVSHCDLGMAFALNAGPQFNRFIRNIMAAGPISSMITSVEVATLTLSGSETKTSCLAVSIVGNLGLKPRLSI